MSISATSTIRLIIVEDFKLTRLGLRSFLSQDSSIEIIGEAADGEIGLSLAKRLMPDVVLLDLGLPGMDGIQTAQEIKAFDKNIKIIILTSHEEDKEVIAALGSGASGYCLKDIDPNRLIEVIKSVASGAVWLDPRISANVLQLYPKPTSVSNLGAINGPVSKEYDRLTGREKEVLVLVAEGKSNNEIAKVLIVSIHTAKAHVCSILQKLYVDDRVQAAVKAVKNNWV